MTRKIRLTVSFVALLLCVSASLYAEETAAPAAPPAGDTTSAGDSATAGDSTAAGDAAASADVAKGDETEGEEDSKWWSLSFSYQLSHEFKSERPVVGNAFSIDPGFVLPEKINLGLHFGFWISTQYPSGITGGNDVTVNTVDGDPISLSLSRAFQIDPDVTGFTITPSVLQLFPFSSRNAFQVNKWYYAIKPGVSFSLAKWGLRAAYSIGVTKNFHGDAYVWLVTESGREEPIISLSEWALSMNASLSYSVWKMNFAIGGGWSRSWLYHPDRQETPKNSVNYNASVGIDAYDGLNITIGATTAGPERRFGGFKDDYTLPFDPKYTTGFLSLSYSM